MIASSEKNIFKPAITLFILRPLPFDHFAFPRWQSVLAITFIGLLSGLAPDLGFSAPSAGIPSMPLWLVLAVTVLSFWVAFLVSVGILRWWMQRKARWDGQGNLFNLLATAWLVADILGATLTLLGIPQFMTLPLWIYSIWVGANALCGAIPKATLGYSIGGIVISIVIAIPLVILLSTLIGAGMAILGL